MPETDAVTALAAAGFVAEPGHPVERVDAPIVHVVLGVKDWPTVKAAEAIAAEHGSVCNFFVWPQPAPESEPVEGT